MEDKLRECFSEMVVYKDLKKTSFFKSLTLPSFLRDWLLKKFCDDDGNFDTEEISEFVKTYMPRKEEWISIKNRIVYENERVQLLTKVSIDIDIKTGAVSFSLPDFGLSYKETIIEPHIWEQFKGDLVNGGETWGVIELGYRFPDDEAKPRIPGKIKMTQFISFCPYTVDMQGMNSQSMSGLMYCSEQLIIMQRAMPMRKKNLLC